MPAHESFDPDLFPLEADLSRADVRVLHRLCADKRVVEIGCGGSTVLLAQFCREVRSFDTSADWIERAQRRLLREPAAVQAVVLGISAYAPGAIPEVLPEADVYFVDGICEDRPAWVRAVVTRRLAPLVVHHDSRSSCMTTLHEGLPYPVTLALQSLEYHVDGSNMAVLRCGAPVVYENWNETERAHRLPFLGGTP